jgi:hypothetical protein
MKFILAALVAVFSFLLVGCTTTAELEFLRGQKEERLALIKFNDDAETRAARIFIEINKEREKTKQEEAKAAVVRAGAIMKIAEKADAGGRVAMARSLEERAPIAGMAAADLVMPKPAFIALPPVQMPKSAFEKGVEVVDRLWGRANGTASTLLAYKGLGKQLDADVRRTELQEAGNTARHGATMGAFGRSSDNQASQSIEATRGFAAALAEESKNPDQVFNVSGNDNQFALNGSQANRVVNNTTNTVQCPQTQTARSGDSGTGGDGGTSTTGGNTAAPSGQTAPTTAVQTAHCNAGK